MIITQELCDAIKRFQAEFGDIVPMIEIPPDVDNEELIGDIDSAIETHNNFLPGKYKYAELDENPDITI